MMPSTATAEWPLYTTSFDVPGLGAAGTSSEIAAALQSAFAAQPDIALESYDASEHWMDPGVTVTVSYRSPLPTKEADAAAIAVASGALGFAVEPKTTIAQVTGAVTSAIETVSGSSGTIKLVAIAASILGVAYILGFFKSRQ
jgi:hypothetical protein